MAGLLLFVVGGAAAELLFGPLGVFSFIGFFCAFVGPFLMWQSHRELRHRGDLEVEIEPRIFRYRYGRGAWGLRRGIQSVLVEKNRIDIIAEGQPLLILLLPFGEEEKRSRVAELGALGVVVTHPDRSIPKMVGLAVAVVVGVGALLVLWRLLVLGLFGLVLLGIHWIAPDDPGVQIGLFFGLAFGVALPILVFDRLSRWRGA